MDHHFGPRFRVLHWCTDQIINDALAQMELTASQGRIIGYIARQQKPPCPRDIEDHFHLSHPSVSGTLNRMEKKGFIRFQVDESDHRIKRIYMQPKGAQCCERLDQVIADIERRIVTNFGPEEQTQFSRMLDQAIRNMGVTPCKSFQKEEIE